jgi:hypothetical protein
VDAQKFLNRRPTYADLRELQRTQRSVQALEHKNQILIDHVRKLQEMTTGTQIANLQQQKDEAVSLGNKEQVNKLDEQIDKLKAVDKLPDAQPGLDPVVQGWVEAAERDWYRADEELRASANIHQDGLLRQGISVEKSLQMTDAFIRRVFPERFKPVAGNGNGNGHQPTEPSRRTPVAGGGARGNGKPGMVSESQLNDTEKFVLAGFLRDKVMTTEQYLERLTENRAKAGR